MRISNVIAQGLMDYLLSNIDSVTPTLYSRIEIYEGAYPSTTGSPDGNLLITITLKNPAFIINSNTGQELVYELDYPDPLTVTASGDASYFRLKNAANDTVLMGTVTGQSGSGDMKITTTTIRPSLLVRITSFLIRLPKE